MFRKAVGLIISLLLTFVLFCDSLLIIIQNTALKYDFIKSYVEKSGVYDEIDDSLKNNLKSLLKNSGVSDEFIVNITPKNIMLLFDNNLSNFYGYTSTQDVYDKYIEEYNSILLAEIKAEAARQNISENELEEEKVNELFISIKDTVSEVTSPIPYTSKLSNYVTLTASITEKLVYFFTALSVLLLVALLILSGTEKERSVFKYGALVGLSYSLIDTIFIVFLTVTRPVSRRLGSYIILGKIAECYTKPIIYGMCLCLTIGISVSVLSLILKNIKIKSK